jgi:diguanylate cyclase (GGDEF)-like protein/PAS domain S-box-containing protein
MKLASLKSTPLARLSMWVALGGGVALTLLAWGYSISQVQNDARARFDSATRTIAGELRSRIDGYNSVLYSLQGLLQSARVVDAATFAGYVEHLRLDLRQPGIREVSYSAYVPHRHKEDFEKQAGAGVDRPAAGFSITPPGARPEYLVLLYRHPATAAAPPIGTDLGADPANLPVIDRARATGIPTAAIPDSDHPDLLQLHLAAYRGDPSPAGAPHRRQGFAGLLSVTFGARHLVDRVLGDLALRDMHVRITDMGYLGAAPGRGGGRPIYGSPDWPGSGVATGFSDRRSIEIGQREWLIEFAAPRAQFTSPAATLLPWTVLAGGLAVSALLFGLVRSVATSWERATGLAQRMTQDLRASEARLSETQRMTQQLIEALPNPIYFMAPDGRYLGVNKAWEAFFGLQRSDFLGRTVHDLFPHDRAAAGELEEMDRALWQHPGTQVHETTVTTRDGVRHDVIYYKATYTRGDGSVAGLVGTIIDITDRKRAERRQAMEQAVTRVLAEARAPSETLPEIIRTVCELSGWQFGAYWRREESTGELRCDESRAQDAPQIRDFAAASRGETIAAQPGGQGLVERCGREAKAVWISDDVPDSRADRAALAARAGLRGAFGFPVLLGNQVLGVMEFRCREARKPDDALIDAAGSIGNQIGQYLVRKQAEAAVTFVATHDALTDLPNRAMFSERLAHAIAQAKRHRRRLAVLFIDLDRFKVINDTLGHDSGDALLREVAKRLAANLRSGDTVARLGGDEFVVLAEDVADPVYVGGLAARLIAALGEGFVLDGQDYHVTASIGVSTYPDDSEDMQTLLKNADIAMYRAKEQGRNGFQFYSNQMNVHSVERLALESSLRRALGRDEMILHYQPQIDVRGGRITGVEALLRWRHPELGLVPPGKFIPLAEETGLIVPIGEWVLHTACAAQRHWQSLGLPPLRIAVNLSPRQFMHGDVVKTIREAVRQAPGDLWRIEVEITESMVMHNPERSVDLIRAIKEMGVQVAMDDFGTGYSSLAYLKRFPIDSLKIDRSFIQDIPRDRGDAAITQAVIGMAHSLALRVVAEGVETHEQFEFLRDHGCDELQGYYFSPPLAEPEVTALLGNRAG